MAIDKGRTILKYVLIQNTEALIYIIFYTVKNSNFTYRKKNIRSMNTTIPKKDSATNETMNLVNLLEGKRFNEILMAVVSVAAVLVILWG